MKKNKTWKTTIFINDDYFTIYTTRRLKPEEICKIYKCEESEIMGIEEEYIGG